jgi:hypothetical protein
MQKQDHMFNKMEEMFSFLKSIATLGSQTVHEGGKTLDVVADKVIGSHDGNMAMVSNIQIIGQDLLCYVSHFVALGCYVS